MTRINVYSQPDEYGTFGSPGAGPELLGWFDDDKAEIFHQDKRWDGSNMIGVITGSQWVDEYLYRTKGGRWVRYHDAHRAYNGPRVYEFLTDKQARDWLLRSECNDDAVQRFFGEIEEERGPGRPKIGGKALISIGDDLLGQVDAYAKENGTARAEVVRIALGEFLTAARPYAISFRDISTGLRETYDERYATLGEAVEALREYQRGDYEAQQYRGLPSSHPRVEHDGRPVDVEAYDG